jgi:hypothetical protein
MLKVAQSITNQPWQDWSPTLSTDVGDQATSFASLTIQLARYSIIGKSVSVTVNFNALLNAIVPAQIRVSLPSGCVPQNALTYSPASVYNGVSYETGLVRPVAAVDALIVYRANFANFVSGSPVEGRFAFTFEIV